MCSGDLERWVRFCDGGWWVREMPWTQGVAGRMGRGAKLPPQLGQMFWRWVFTQSAQKVHS